MILRPLTPETAGEESAAILKTMEQTIGMIPNIYSLLAHSPKALKAYLKFDQELEEGEFSPLESQAVKLAVSQANASEYCLAAHSAVVKMLGMKEDEILAVRRAVTKDPKLSALTALAREIVLTRGFPEKNYLDNFFEAGYSKAALIELIGLVALKTFSNYFHHIAGTPVDFPMPPGLSD